MPYPGHEITLDIVNCSKSADTIAKYGCYSCPARKGAYSHRRCKYFGVYQDKKIFGVAPIDAIVDLYDDRPPMVVGGFGTAPREKYIDQAIKFQAAVKEPFPLRVFVLGRIFSTDIEKDTTRGMIGTKIYFDVKRFQPKSAEDLGKKLHGSTWTQLGLGRKGSASILLPAKSVKSGKKS